MNKTRIRVINILLVIILTLCSLTACAGINIQTADPSQKSPVDEPEAGSEESSEPDKEELTEPANEQTENNTDAGDELIPGGDFRESNSFWGIYTESGGSANFGISAGHLELKISDPGKVGHAVQLFCDGFELCEGARYSFSAEISSDVPRYFEWRIQQNGGDYHPYIDLEKIEIGPDTTVISADFTMDEASDPAPRMCFNLGDAAKEQGLGAHTICLDNVSLVITDDSNIKKDETMKETSDVNINQIGYLTNAEKRAVIRDADEKGHFSVIDISDGSSAYEGDLQKGLRGGSSGDVVCYADFSKLNKPGKYKVVTDANKESFEFEISDDVYKDVLTDSVRMFYLQRCGCALPDNLAGDFSHDVCHGEEAQIYNGDSFIEVSGGWHDAGDYGRYTVPAAKAVADLLLAYELFPDKCSGDMNIPESGNGVPDILNEARYELEWLFKMQADDGSIYHKVTGLNFDGFIKADECTEKLYVLPTSKTATADFAGVMYMASRIYRKYDAGFADRCIKAADRALDAYYLHQDERNYTNPSDVNTGEYGDGCSVDELLWAICEGYKTTGDRKFEKLLSETDISRIKSEGFGWADMSGYAYFAYLTSDDRMKCDTDLEDRFFKMCDEMKDIALSVEAYGSTIKDDYPWGSNMTIANNGMALLMAYRLTGNDDYRLAASRQLDHLLGVNANSYCYLTGYGTLCPEKPHHRPSQAVGKCMKGMLVGGPDSGLEDPYAKAVLTGLPKARCYTDNEQSYSCNEITIYWNSPFVFLLAGLS